MADEENNINRKQENQEDIVSPDENPDITQPEENLRQAAENLREEAKMVDENKPDDSIQPQKTSENKTTEVNTDQGDPEKVAKRIGNANTGILGRRPIIIVLIVGAIVLSGFLLYSQIQLSNQAYKIENFNALWNQSLADLRSGNTSIDEYCNNRVHDEDICNRFKSLQYMN
ncbi:MAG TPA: hypothetical protein VJ772_05185 [Nitrososphaeraceae archaeon]|jgi:hypothetical protein|nr:hypothetical protein [Nitrososphaeraceae archaeon]